jgi:hypothetical protein
LWQIDAKSQTAILLLQTIDAPSQTVYRLWTVLSWIPIHQVAMHHDPASVKLRVTQPPCSTVLPYLSISTNGLRLLRTTRNHQYSPGCLMKAQISRKLFQKRILVRKSRTIFSWGFLVPMPPH